MDNELSLHATIRGRVQGVGFRYFAYLKAKKHGIAGFVKNIPEGALEVYAEGKKEDLEEFLTHIKKGPFFAKVEDCEAEWKEASSRHDSFLIL